MVSILSFIVSLTVASCLEMYHEKEVVGHLPFLPYSGRTGKPL
jgi:hypothetical protein